MKNETELYDKIVADQSDLIDHIAYSLFKRDELNYVKKHRINKRVYPAYEDILDLRKINTANESIERYRKSAEDALTQYGNNILGSEKASTDEYFRTKLEPILNKDDKSNGLKSFFYGASQSFVGTIMYSLLIALGLLAAYVFENDPLSKWVDDKIEEKIEVNSTIESDIKELEIEKDDTGKVINKKEG